jgi:hypothetical protein
MAPLAETDMRDVEPPELSELTHWVYELLDAHRDTARMAEDLERDPEWSAHLCYLRDLQRHGREALALLHACGNATTPPKPGVP